MSRGDGLEGIVSMCARVFATLALASNNNQTNL